MTQLKDRLEMIKLEVKQATDEQDKLAEVMNVFSPEAVSEGRGNASMFETIYWRHSCSGSRCRIDPWRPIERSCMYSCLHF